MKTRKLSRRQAGALALSIGLATSLTVTLGPDSVQAQPSSAPKKPNEITLGPAVTHTGKAPTGYNVTFRVYDPTATSMRIKGAWSFASATTTAVDPLNTAPISAPDWRPGDVPLPSPNGANENWPVANMVQDSKTGIWSYTVSLPSGWFDYQFYRDCTAPVPTVTGCSSETDPANPAPVTNGSQAVFSQVYVPSDPKFGTVDYFWQAEAPADERGQLIDVTIPVTGSSTATDRLAIYTPAGYDASRATKYPLFVLSHGGGENEIAWPTRGRAAQIVDNLIATKQIQPAIIVMPTGVGSGDAYAAEIENTVVPYMEQHYNVGTTANDQAYAGTSGYGREAANLLFNHTDNFGYYGLWSPASGAPGYSIPAPGQTQLDPAYTNPELKTRLGIDLAIGQEDIGGNAMITAVTEREGLIHAGVPFRFFTEDGGHTWQFWRDVLHHFLTTTAFRATTTSVSATASNIVATVSPATDEPATPTGKVQFILNGTKLGQPVELHGSQAKISGGVAQPGDSVTAVYTGDKLYNSSTSSATAVAS